MPVHTTYINWDTDPVMFSPGGHEVYWYGFSWFLAMAAGTLLIYTVCRREDISLNSFLGLFAAGYLSPLIGARLGHVFFYDWEYYSGHPDRILAMGEGGMASHGAALGLLAGLAVFSLAARKPYIWSLDRIMLPVALGGALVRLGNLANSEIYGTTTELPWGFIFVRAGETVPKHPTQIYEAICYLATFGVLVWLYFSREAGRRAPGLMLGTGLVGIFLSRFVIEFVKNPQAPFEEEMTLNMGQWLSIPFTLAGMVAIFVSLRKRHKA